MMSALMSDLVEGRITPGAGNAICNAGGKLLKNVEMAHRYGVKQGVDGGERVLILASDEPETILIPAQTGAAN